MNKLMWAKIIGWFLLWEVVCVGTAILIQLTLHTTGAVNFIMGFVAGALAVQIAMHWQPSLIFGEE